MDEAVEAACKARYGHNWDAMDERQRGIAMEIMAPSIRVADAARAVGDEEVVHQIARWHFNMDWPNENFSRVEEVQPDRFASYIDKGKIGLFALRAAGLKVVRG